MINSRNHITIFIISILLSVFLVTCEEEEEPIFGSIIIETLPVEIYTDTTATLIGRILHADEELIECGHYWWENVPDATLMIKASDSIKLDSFTCHLSGLLPATSYYAKAYATDGTKIVFGQIVEFTTWAELPTIITTEISSITTTSAQSGGDVTNDGGSQVTAKGVCWSISENPSIEDNTINNSIGTGNFISNITGLLPNTTYYVRAYATNSQGTSYGEQVSFTTIYGNSIPILISPSEGEILDNGCSDHSDLINWFFDWDECLGATKYQLYVIGRTATIPVIDIETVDSEFKYSDYGYIAEQNRFNWTWKARAYINGEWGEWSNDRAFNVEALNNDCSIQSGSFTDPRDGHTYKYIKIGDQLWMAENLKYLPAASPPTEGSQTEPIYYVYDYNGKNVSEAKTTSNYNIYGVLYNWPAAMNGETSSNSNPSGVQGVCPSGWHLPSDAEWTTLIDYLGGESIAGGKLKETGTTHWESPNTGATNETGFTALPGGLRYSSETFGYMTKFGVWWSSSEGGTNSAWQTKLSYDLLLVGRGFSKDKEHGFSVRCVKD